MLQRKYIYLTMILTLIFNPMILADINQQIWRNEPAGGNLDGLKAFHANKRPGNVLDPAPTEENVLPESMWSGDLGSDYTDNLWGWITVPKSGDYAWFLHADEHATLYISPDIDMGNLAEVASIDGRTSTGQWDKYESQKAEPVAYIRGDILAVYAIHREGGGGDNLGIGWTMPNSNEITYISPYVSATIPIPGIAKAPNPADGATGVSKDIELSIAPDPDAKFYTPFFGEDYDTVASATGYSPLLEVPIFNPDGLLEPGKTYYWRVDIQTLFGTNIGPVWSFTTEPLVQQVSSAENLGPADGATEVPQNTVLRWNLTLNAVSSRVLFGTDPENLQEKVTLDHSNEELSLDPGPLEDGQTYYWQIIEITDNGVILEGPVWSFTTAKVGGGVKGNYFSGKNFESLVLTRTDPRIDFNWGNDGPDPLVGDDLFSVRWTGEVEAAFTENYTFYTNSNDGIRLWINGEQLVNNWTDHENTENRGMIDLVAGQKYSMVMEYYENSGGAVAQLRWSSPSTPKQIIPEVLLSFLVHAYHPKPVNGYMGLNLMSDLKWSPGDFASSHEVYLGTDDGAVLSATTASPEYKGTKAIGDEIFDPGLLNLDTTYFWRIDEVADDGMIVRGDIWSFSTADFIPIIDVNVTLTYDNTIEPFYSEFLIIDTDISQDWTESPDYILPWKQAVWQFRGNSDNDAEQLYVVVEDSAGNMAVFEHPDGPDVVQIETLVDFPINFIDIKNQGVDLGNINNVSVGIGDPDNPTAGGKGEIVIENILLALPSGLPPGSDGAITIDNFINVPELNIVVQSNNATPISEAATVLGSMLGGELDMQGTVSSAAVGEGLDTANVCLYFRLDPSSTGELILTYDGIDGSAEQVQATSGLGGIDITNGGTQDGIELVILKNDIPFEASIVLFTDPDDSSELTQTIPSTAEPATVKYPFSEFLDRGSGADLADIQAIMVVLGPGVGVIGPVDIELYSIRTYSSEFGPGPTPDKETVEYQVSDSEDDGFASNDQFQNLDGDFLRVGSSAFSQPPYYLSGMVFRNVDIPQGAEIVSARLKVRSHNSRLTDTVHARIEAEAVNDATAFSSSRHIGSLLTTGTAVDWILEESWSVDTWYESPDITGVIQEVIDRTGWSAGNSLALICNTISQSGNRNISSFDRGSNSAPVLEITYIPR